MNRRTFLLESTAGAAIVAGRHAWPALPRDARVAPRIRFGYAAITWGGNDPQAIDDIAALGFTGIQLRDAAVKRWRDRPDELKTLLADRKLAFVALSSGNLPLDPAKEKDSFALHVSHAKFLRAAGGRYLQIIDERPTGRTPVPDDYRRMGRLLTELGRRTADVGIPLALHNHMGALSESPEEVRRVLDATDPRFVKLELDIAHYHQAGGKPADAVREHAGRLLFLHIKDVESPVPGGKPDSYRFVELGRGKVDVPGVFAALEAVKFDGWAIVELDEVPDKARTPKESGEIAKRFLEGLGLTPTAR
jgi:inosose dehydratase